MSALDFANYDPKPYTRTPVLYRAVKSGMVGFDRAQQVVFGLTLEPTEHGQYDALKEEIQEACDDAEIELMDDLVEGELYKVTYLPDSSDDLYTDYTLQVWHFTGDPAEYYTAPEGEDEDDV